MAFTYGGDLLEWIDSAGVDRAHRRDHGDRKAAGRDVFSESLIQQIGDHSVGLVGSDLNDVG